jgi:phage protein D
MAGNNGSTAGLKAARPMIAIGGQDQPALTHGLLSLEVVEDAHGLYRCEASFGNWGTINGGIGFLYFDRRTLDFGKPFAVKLGTDTIFDGRIMGLEGQFPEGRSPELTVLAEDRLQDLRMTRRTRTFADLSDADVIRRIAGDHGLTPNVDVPGGAHKVLAQVNQSDLAFLRERARAIDAELWMDGSKLFAKSHAGRNAGKLTLTYGRELREFAVAADLAGQRTSVTVNGWDVSSKRGLQHEATDSVLSGELNGDASGASLLQTALGQRKEALAHTVPLNSSDAQARAETHFRRTARRFVRGRGVAETSSKLRVGAYVDLRGLGPLFNGKYYVAEMCCLFDGTHGLRTEFMAERPGLGRA